MHRDIEVLSGEYDTDQHVFSSVRILNETHLPYGSYEKKKFSLSALNHWIYWRGIPKYRLDLEHLLKCLHMHSSHALLEYTHHVSVSDTYWIRKADEDVTWEDVNFYRHSYDQNSFAKASFTNMNFEAASTARYTPNNTLNGFQKKAWMKQKDGSFLLYKGGTSYQEEPVNEWLASRIAEVLHIPHTHYDILKYNDNTIVSVCPSLCDEHTDLIPAGDLLGLIDGDDEVFQLNAYIDLLVSRGIKDAPERLDDMILLDYIMQNTDRHDQNLGVLVDADTNAIISVAPIFDTGTGLGALVTDDKLEEHITLKNCRLFNARNFSHQALLKLMADRGRYDIQALKEIPKEYGETLLKYQSATNMSRYRINELYKLLYRRIRLLEKSLDQ